MLQKATIENDTPQYVSHFILHLRLDTQCIAGDASVSTIDLLHTLHCTIFGNNCRAVSTTVDGATFYVLPNIS